ncbi:hypothetical protein LJC31_05145, partial [Synergistaceae bacterium OttesenSCG-928-I11]|nr:hypothetical protein [Synergistaceae bacterium OttesenSCG-928-I11]
SKLFNGNGSGHELNGNKHRRVALPDIGQGSLALTDDMYSGGSRSRILFLQTNEGVMHAMNIDRANPKHLYQPNADIIEMLSFVPPNVYHGTRIFAQKFDTKIENGKIVADKWLTHTEDSNGEKDYVNPSFTTDGAIATFDFIDKGTDTMESNGIFKLDGGENVDALVKTYAFGMMGRGGAGLYSLKLHKDDVSKENAFKFNWAVENNMYRYKANLEYIAGYGDNSTGRLDGETVVWSPLKKNGTSDTYPGVGYGQVNAYSASTTFLGEKDDDKDYNYWRMGWNMPEPAFGMLEFKNKSYANVMVLAAGQQYVTALGKGGTIGSAMYVVNPLNGLILSRRTSNSTIKDANPSGAKTNGTQNFRPNPLVGMVITPPTPVYRETRKIGKNYEGRFLRSAFTADHRGEIFEINLAGETNSGGYNLLSSFDDITYRRIATLQPKSNSEESLNDSHVIPYRFAVLEDGKDLWICGGTANVPTLNVTVKHYNIGGSDFKSEKLENKEQYIFGFRRREPGAEGDVSQNQLCIRDQEKNTINAWHVVLETEGRGPETCEYVSSPPLITSDGYLYVTTYVPANGLARAESRLYKLDPKTGKGQWGDRAKGKNGMYASMGEISAKGLSEVNVDMGGDRGIVPVILVSYSYPDATSKSDLINGFKDQDIDSSNIHHEGNAGVQMLDIIGSGNNNNNGDPDYSTIYYWRRYTEPVTN